MKIFSSITITNSGPVCRDCTHFRNDPAMIEKTYPGLAVMSSGFASVRDQDGFCNCHELYLSARDSCKAFSACTAESNKILSGKD